MPDLNQLVPLLRDLNEKRKAQYDAFIAVNRLLRMDGFSLYWDDTEERYCMYALPQLLDGTYQTRDEEDKP